MFSPGFKPFTLIAEAFQEGVIRDDHLRSRGFNHQNSQGYFEPLGACVACLT
jgi:hypothetical protein